MCRAWQEPCSPPSMTTPQTILVPTDFSEASKAALAYAVDLAEAVGAAVHVVHAFELPFVGFPDGNVTVSAEMANRIIGAAAEGLREVSRVYEGRKVRVTTILEQADPREAVLTAAEKVGADLIVMATHGRRGIARILIGSTTEAVVRTSSVPVLTVHGAKQG